MGGGWVPGGRGAPGELGAARRGPGAAPLRGRNTGVGSVRARRGAALDAERALSADDRVWVEGAAGEDPVGIEALVARLRAAGLSLASSLDAGVTVIVRTRAAVSLAALLGSSPSVAQVARMGRASAVRWMDEDALARPRVGTPALAPTDEPSREALLSCAGDSDALDRELRRFRAPGLIALGS